MEKYHRDTDNTGRKSHSRTTSQNPGPHEKIFFIKKKTLK